jgi:hypothetical protein
MKLDGCACSQTLNMFFNIEPKKFPLHRGSIIESACFESLLVIEPVSDEADESIERLSCSLNIGGSTTFFAVGVLIAGGILITGGISSIALPSSLALMVEAHSGDAMVKIVPENVFKFARTFTSSTSGRSSDDDHGSLLVDCEEECRTELRPSRCACLTTVARTLLSANTVNHTGVGRGGRKGMHTATQADYQQQQRQGRSGSAVVA